MLVVFTPFLTLAFAGVYFSNKEDEKKRNQWRVIAKGIYDYAVYGEYDYTVKHRSGAMVHHTSTTVHVMKVAAVYFCDGRTCVMEGRRDMPFPQGTVVHILENGLNELRIEGAE
ncbi:MAG: hypothetical protein KGI60_00490 [Patescibacteria group bacterium]|nr:hypothetical protein [Patescibacteria group bacterium]